MIIKDDIFIADLKDDFELEGKNNEEFSLFNFINGDLNKAFWFGFYYDEWKESIWIPFMVRKQVRHLYESIVQYNPQLEWLNSKRPNNLMMLDYVNYILDNIIYESYSDLVKIAIVLGIHVKSKYND